MANHKSAKKRYKQSEARRIQNKSYISRLKTEVANCKEKLKTAKEAAEKIKLVSKIQSLFDKTASKGLIHKNKAARSNSRVVHKYL
jgi:small subunit ribosomal protein S20